MVWFMVQAQMINHGINFMKERNFVYWIAIHIHFVYLEAHNVTLFIMNSVLFLHVAVCVCVTDAINMRAIALKISIPIQFEFYKKKKKIWRKFQYKIQPNGKNFTTENLLCGKSAWSHRFWVLWISINGACTKIEWKSYAEKEMKKRSNRKLYADGCGFGCVCGCRSVKHMSSWQMNRWSKN